MLSDLFQIQLTSNIAQIEPEINRDVINQSVFVKNVVFYESLFYKTNQFSAS